MFKVSGGKLFTITGTDGNKYVQQGGHALPLPT
jgi:hypothetical protein